MIFIAVNYYRFFVIILTAPRTEKSGRLLLQQHLTLPEKFRRVGDVKTFRVWGGNPYLRSRLSCSPTLEVTKNKNIPLSAELVKSTSLQKIGEMVYLLAIKFSFRGGQIIRACYRLASESLKVVDSYMKEKCEFFKDVEKVFFSSFFGGIRLRGRSQKATDKIAFLFITRSVLFLAANWLWPHRGIWYLSS